jgi:transposase
MNKDYYMISAKSLRAHGCKIKDIAVRLNKSERTIYYYLTSDINKKFERIYPSKLDNFKTTVDSILENNPNYNRELIYSQIKKLGYKGGITTLRVYAAKKCEMMYKKAVIRFETEPGYQAQVDWKVFGNKIVNSKKQKIYAFVMVMGYSRMPFVCFTTSMNMSTFLYCQILAFIFFGGIPKEILYDNMKTAFICDTDGVFKPNKKLLLFANHYGFLPRRCQIRRPQTKGKVERFIDYLLKNFIPQISFASSNIDELNEKVICWIKEISEKTIRELQDNRINRFNHEKSFLNLLPAKEYDIREEYMVYVDRESFINFKTNKYSVDPAFLGLKLTLLFNPVKNEADLYDGKTYIRTFSINTQDNHKKIYLFDDKNKILTEWKKQFDKKEKQVHLKKNTEVDAGHPEVFDRLFNTGDNLCTN